MFFRVSYQSVRISAEKTFPSLQTPLIYGSNSAFNMNVWIHLNTSVVDWIHFRGT